MSYSTSADVRLIIHTSLTNTEIESIISMSDAQINKQIGAQDPTDLTIKKLSVLMTAHTIKQRQPDSVTIGEYRETTGNINETLSNEINKILKLYKSPAFASSTYTSINEEQRYGEEP